MNTSLIKTVLRESHVAHLQSGVLVLFLILFVLIGVWVFWPGSKSYYDRIAKDLLKGE